MANNPIRRIITLCVLLACLCVMWLPAQDYKTLLGRWQMTSETGDDPVKWMLILKETDGKLDATVAAEDKEAPVKDFSYAGGEMKFRVPYEGEYYDLDLKVNGDKLIGTWSGGGNSGRTTGAKL